MREDKNENRWDKLLQIHVEVLEPAYVKVNQADVQNAIGAFILRAAEKATQNGVPVTFAKWDVPGNLED